MAKAKKKARMSKEERESAAFFRKFDHECLVNATNVHLNAFKADHNPLHILRAVLEVSVGGEALDAAMIHNLELAIKMLDKRPKQSSNTMRNLRILERAYQVSNGTFPNAELSDRVVSRMAQRERISVGNMRTILSRLRAQLRKQQEVKTLESHWKGSGLLKR